MQFRRKVYTAVVLGALLAGTTALPAQTPTATPAGTQAAPALPQGLTLRAYVDQQDLLVGDPFVYSVELSGNAGEVTLDVPPFSQTPGLELLDGPRINREFNVTAARSVFTLRWDYRLKVTNPGSVEIPSSKVRIGGTWYDTGPVKLTVKEPAPTAQELTNIISATTGVPEINRQLNQNYFALAEVPEKVYRGQVVPLTVYVYRSPNLREFEQWERVEEAKGPDFITPAGATVQAGRGSTRWEKVTMGGREFLRVAIYRTFIIPAKSGKLRLEPPRTRVYLQLENRRPRSMMDMYALPASLIDADLMIRPMTIDVLDLPPKPAEAVTQVVGSIVGRVTTDRPNGLPQNELVTITVSLAGAGFLDLISPPKLPDFPGLTLIDTNVKTDAAIDQGRYVSRKDFEYVYQATEAGEVNVPELAFAVFDPNTGTQEIKRSEAFSFPVTPSSGTAVRVGGTVAQSAPAAANRPGVRELGTDVAYIDRSPLTAIATSPGSAFYLRPWFWLLQVIPVAAAFLYGMLALRSQRVVVESATVRARRSRDAAEQAVKQARTRLANSNRDEFYSLLAGGMMSYVAALLGRSSKGLTIEEASSGLRERGVPAEATDRLEAVLKSCDAIRYSPAPDTPEAREKALQEAEATLLALEGDRQ